MCLVTDMKNPTKTFEDNNIPGNLDEEAEKSIPENKILDLALTRYMDREEKLN